MTHEAFHLPVTEEESGIPEGKLPGCYGLDEPDPLTPGELAAVNRQYRKESEHVVVDNGSGPSRLAPGLKVRTKGRSAKGPADVRRDHPWLTRDHREEPIKV